MKGLGKGLSALISEKNLNPNVEGQEKEETLKQSNIDDVLISRLQPGKFQPRSYFNEDELNELAESIRKNGVVQPIIARPLGKKDHYEIIAGERRWRAAKIVGLKSVPVIIMELSDKSALEVALVENIQRQNLKPLEEAEGYKRLIAEFNYKQEQLSEVIGKSRSQIANTLRLLDLPDSIKDHLNSETITAGHARAMLTANKPDFVLKKVVKEGLNVRQTESLVKKLSEDPVTKTAKKSKHPQVLSTEKEAFNRTGLKIKINDKGGKGTITLKYESVSELENIIKRLENYSMSLRASKLG